VFHRKFKFIGLHRSGASRTETGLNQLTFICFEDITFFHHVIELAGFYPVAKNPEISPVNKTCQSDKDDGDNYKEKPFHLLEFLINLFKVFDTCTVIFRGIKIRWYFSVACVPSQVSML